MLRVAVLSVIAGLLAGCTIQRSPITGNKRAYGYSWDRELEIGRTADPQIVAEYGVYDDAEVTAYINAVGERVLAQSHLRRTNTPAEYRIDFTFRVLDSPILNAFALPGGYVYVTRGLLAHMANEAQLAMVLGHEIAHVAARHSSQQALKTQLSQIGVVGGAIVGEVIAGVGGELLQTASLATQLLLLSYSRASETESDKLGVEYAAKAGYRAGEGAGFFKMLARVSEKAGSRIPGWQSTHPDPGDREETILALAAQWEASLNMEEEGRAPLLAAVEGIVVGENPRQGFVRDNVFYHPDLAFRFPIPPKWTLYNFTTKVAMVSDDQQAVVIVTLAPGTSPRDAANQFADTNGLTIIEHEAELINGNNAYRVVAKYREANQAIGIVTHFIAYRDLIFQMMGYAALNQFSTQKKNLERSAEGFIEELDPKILSTQPTTIQLVTVDKAALFETFLPDLPSSFSTEDVAILNQLFLNSDVEKGVRLKIPFLPREGG